MDIIGSVVAIMVVGITSVVLRMFTRLMKTGPGLAIDDYFILFAAVGASRLRGQKKTRTNRETRGTRRG